MTLRPDRVRVIAQRQPIDTAPRDGRLVRLSVESRPEWDTYTMKWVDGRWVNKAGIPWREPVPFTHWEPR